MHTPGLRDYYTNIEHGLYCYIYIFIYLFIIVTILVTQHYSNVPVNTMKAYRGSRSIAALILNLGTRLR